MPIDLLAQSAALFCPYRFRKFEGANGWINAMTVLFQQSHMPSLPYCRGPSKKTLARMRNSTLLTRVITKR